MEKSLSEIYNGMLAEKLKRRDITASTSSLLAKSHPKSPVVLDYEAELFGISPEEMKRLPIKAVEMFQQALNHLINATKTEPTLRQALRKLINFEFKKAEQVPNTTEPTVSAPSTTSVPSIKKESAEFVTDEIIIEAYKNFLSMLVESNATKFNYKRLIDLDPTKISNPFFLQILATFELVDFTRPQKQGVLLFLKKLAELAETNPMIAQALNKIVRVETKNDMADKQSSVEFAPVI